MVRCRVVILALFGCLSSYGQIGGNATYQFLNLMSSPRQASLGGKTITNIDYDVSQGLYNPAAINPEMDHQLAINFANYLGDISYGTAAYAFTIDRRVQTFHIGVQFVNYGKFDGYDNAGIPTNEFSASESALSLGYARRLGRSDFYGGAAVKIITSKLEQYNSIGLASDVGLVYINEDLDFNLAIAFRNLGVQLKTYAGLQEYLPFEITLGLSQKLENVPIRWHLTFENLQQWPLGAPSPARVETDLEGNQTDEQVSFANKALRHVIFGAELFPDRGFNLRIGYSFRRAEELRILEQRNFSGLSFGFGIKLNNLRLSFTHARFAAASNTSFFGMQLQL